MQKIADCQLQAVYESGGMPSLADRARLLGLRLLSALRRRTYGNRIASVMISSGPAAELKEQLLCMQNGSPEESNARPQPFQSGEMVQIRALEDIQKTLDSNGSFEGLKFMHPMRQFCGRRARVLKKVRIIFDERLWKMVKIRNCYLLENVTCNGRDVFDGEGCDRTCYFFWKDKWLRRIP
jgi:hypothetical protein